MSFDYIEQLKGQYTGKTVLVDDTRPELRRFAGLRGVVKTVNMAGRALVQFDGRKDVGWHDIDVDYLKVVEEAGELAGEEAEAGSKEPSALERAQQQQQVADRSLPSSGSAGG